MSYIEAFKKIFKPNQPIEIFNLTYNCGQPYIIEKHSNLNGYPYPCYACKTPHTYFQYAVINGNGEPQGSIYYCKQCNPAKIDTIRRHYLNLMGYTY